MPSPRSRSSAPRSTAQAPTPAPSAAPARRDLRRWIYVALDVVFAAAYVIAITKLIPNRLPSAAAHLWTFPIAATTMAVGTALGGKTGWRIAVGAGSAMLLSTFLLILRIVISASFLAGVYGSFGKAAATFAMVMVAIVVELVALLPLVQVKYLMTRAGRRAHGVAA